MMMTQRDLCPLIHLRISMFALRLDQFRWMLILLLALRLCHDGIVVEAEVLVSEYLSSTDLHAFGTDVEGVRRVFERFFGQKPGHLSLNDEVYYGHCGPPRVDKENHRCYKKISDPVITLGKPTNTSSLISSTIVRNEGPNNVTHTVSLSGSWTNTISHTTSNTLGVEFKMKLHVSAFLSSGFEVSFSTSTEETRSESAIEEFMTSDVITVPPYSEVNVSMVATIQTQIAHYTSSIWVDGWFGGSHRDTKKHRMWHKGLTFHGHYHTWNFLREKAVLPKINGHLNGRVITSKTIDTITCVGRSSPIDQGRQAITDQVIS